MRIRYGKLPDGSRIKGPAKSDRAARAAREGLDGIIGEMFMDEIKKKYRLDRDAYKNSPEGKRAQARAMVLQELDKSIESADEQIIDLIKVFKDEVVESILEELDLIDNPKKPITVARIKTVMLAYEDHIRFIEEISKLVPLKSAAKYTVYELFFAELMKRNYLFAHFAPKNSLTKYPPRLSFLSRREYPYLKQLFEEYGLDKTSYYETHCATFLDGVEGKKLDVYSLQPEKPELFFTDERIQSRKTMIEEFESTYELIINEKISDVRDFIDDTVGLIIADASTLDISVKVLLEKYYRTHFLALKKYSKLIDFKGEDIMLTFKKEIKSGLERFTVSTENQTPTIE